MKSIKLQQNNDCQRETVRLDQWLWAARFFKTRPVAVQNIKNGRVLVNGQRAKPARTVSVGDTLTIQKTPELCFEVNVLALENKRLGAKLATALYQETEASIHNRQELALRQQLAKSLVQFPTRRPDKRERRALRSLRYQ